MIPRSLTATLSQRRRVNSTPIASNMENEAVKHMTIAEWDAHVADLERSLALRVAVGIPPAGWNELENLR